MTMRIFQRELESILGGWVSMLSTVVVGSLQEVVQQARATNDQDIQISK